MSREKFKFNIQKTRSDISYFKNSELFNKEATEHAAYKKSLQLLTVFSLIYNLAGVTISGTSLGVISGTIQTPEIICIALLFSLIYHFTLYLSYITFVQEKYYLNWTTKSELKKYKDSLAHFIFENNIKNKFRAKQIDIYHSNFCCPADREPDNPYEIQLFINKNEIIQNPNLAMERVKESIDLFDYEFTEFNFMDENSEGFSFAFNWNFDLTDEDVNYFHSHYRELKLLNRKNFIEYRLPVIFAIIALYSYILNWDWAMSYLQKFYHCIF